jgi:hypothetical protein
VNRARLLFLLGIVWAIDFGCLKRGPKQHAEAPGQTSEGGPTTGWERAPAARAGGHDGAGTHQAPEPNRDGARDADIGSDEGRTASALLRFTSAVECRKRFGVKLLRDVGQGSVQLEDLVAREQGLVWLKHVSSVADGGLIRTARHLCGTKIDEQLPRALRLVQDAVKTSARWPDYLWCERSPSPTCSMSHGGHENKAQLVFACRPDGRLILEAVLNVSEASMRREFVEKGRRFIRRELARARRTGCPGRSGATVR